MVSPPPARVCCCLLIRPQAFDQLPRAAPTRHCLEIRARPDWAWAADLQTYETGGRGPRSPIITNLPYRTPPDWEPPPAGSVPH